jgi:hypothetical protein
VPSGSKDNEQPQSIEAKDRKTAPSDRDGSRAYGAQADIHEEVEAESESQSGDDDDTQFHAIDAILCAAL